MFVRNDYCSFYIHVSAGAYAAGGCGGSHTPFCFHYFSSSSRSEKSVM